MAIAAFPHEYVVELNEDQLAAAGAVPLDIGPPSQFGGTDDVWSPEHLLVGAVLACFKTTFDAFCRRENLVVRAFRATATALLARSKEGPVFQVIELVVDVATDDEARARAVVATAERQCIISRALVAPVRVTARVRSAAAQPDAVAGL